MLVPIITTIIVLGLLYWLVLQIPLPPPFPMAIRVVFIIVLILMLLRYLPSGV